MLRMVWHGMAWHVKKKLLVGVGSQLLTKSAISQLIVVGFELSQKEVITWLAWYTWHGMVWHGHKKFLASWCGSQLYTQKAFSQLIDVGFEFSRKDAIT